MFSGFFKLIRKQHSSSEVLLQAIFGGVLAGIAFLKLGHILMPISLAFLWSISTIPFAGFLWGILAVLISHYWLLALHPLTWLDVPILLSLPLAISIWISCGLLGGLLVGSWCFICKFIVKERVYFLQALFLASLWGLVEVSLSHSPFFWISVGSTLLPSDRELAGLSRWFGEGGLSTYQLLLGWWLWKSNFFRSRRFRFKKLTFIGLICLFIAHIVGWTLLQENPNYQNISVAVWQPATPLRTKFSLKTQQRISSELKENLEYAQKLKAQFLVAPEGTLLLNQNLSSPSPIPFLSGGFRSVGTDQRSSVLVFDAGSTTFSNALDKYRLVPLGEWVPNFFKKYLFGISSFGGVSPGSPSRLLNWDSGPPTSIAICYEITDGHAIAKAISQGGQWILTLANLDPYPIALQKQFLALAQLRSIENRRDLVSVANTGPSSIILSSGEINTLIEPFKSGMALGQFHIHTEKTIYSEFKELPLTLLLMTGLIGSLFSDFLGFKFE